MPDCQYCDFSPGAVQCPCGHVHSLDMPCGRSYRDELPTKNVVETSEDVYPPCGVRGLGLGHTAARLSQFLGVAEQPNTSVPPRVVTFCQDCDHSDRCAAAGACQISLVDEESAALEADVDSAPSRLDRFNAAVAAVTDERGNAYGHPKPNFDRVSRLMAVVAECQDPLARHALEMICVKVARLIHTPDHLDSWVDIAGYARTGVMVTD